MWKRSPLRRIFRRVKLETEEESGSSPNKNKQGRRYSIDTINESVYDYEEVIHIRPPNTVKNLHTKPNIYGKTNKKQKHDSETMYGYNDTAIIFMDDYISPRDWDDSKLLLTFSRLEERRGMKLSEQEKKEIKMEVDKWLGMVEALKKSNFFYC